MKGQIKLSSIPLFHEGNKILVPVLGSPPPTRTTMLIVQPHIIGHDVVN